jgi:hypothetical protein
MRGVNLKRSMADGRTAIAEDLRIEQRDDAVYYVARPRGQGETAFRRVESGAGRVVFENPDHDFPKRIMYWRDGDRLHARIEGGSRTLSLQWRRVETPAP